MSKGYRGRIAPTPTGYLHLGHAATFWRAFRRAREAGGCLVFRIEDIDTKRCREEYAHAALEDLLWLGVTFDEGVVGREIQPEYYQSNRMEGFRRVWRQLLVGGYIYPSPHSRKDVGEALTAPHHDGQEPIFPPHLRQPVPNAEAWTTPGGVNWRFRVPDGEASVFRDGSVGKQIFTAGVDFGDFLVWRRDGFPSYELAVVADDMAMGITEVVRGEDLLLSTARQLLLYQALGAAPPMFYHCPLVLDERGERLAKRSHSLALRTLRERGHTPAEVLEMAGISLS